MNIPSKAMMKVGPLLFLAMTLIANTPIAAAEYSLSDEQSRIGNGIYYYYPNDVCGNAGILPATQTDTSGDANAEAILRFFVGKGMTLAAAAGFAGNMKQESGLNPLNVENSKQDIDPNKKVNGVGDAKLAQDNGGKMYTPIDGVGFGLVQWTFGGYIDPNPTKDSLGRTDPAKFESRQGGLYHLAQEKNMDIADINLQLEYVWQELSTSYKTSTLDKVSPMLDPVEAAIVVHDNYEISADSDSTVRTVRGGNAKSYYDQFRGKITDGSGVTSSPTQITTTSGETCGSQVSDDGGIGVAGGITFPLQTTQAAIKKGVSSGDGFVHWCFDSQENCHHDYNAADIFSETGTKIIAAKAGKVVSKTTGSCDYSGCNVSVKGGQDTPDDTSDDILYYYTHMSKHAIVNVGQTVQAGQQLGEVGTNETAMDTPRHLHFDMTRGEFRPSCSGSSCNDDDFINVQPVLVPAFNALPAGVIDV